MIENKQFPQGTPLVSICCITYNHEKFIQKCIDGFLMQETNFPFEVLIHDDASTDHTADIIREYAAQYPDIIKPYFETENCFQKGKRFTVSNYERAVGKYIARCEGDDFWTDPHKLQKQVDYLEEHPKCVFTTHSVAVINSDDTNVEEIFQIENRIYPVFYKHGETMQTSSYVFRNIPYIFNLLSENRQIIVSGDICLKALLFQYGYFYGFEEIMSKYRRHSYSLTCSKQWRSASRTMQWIFIKNNSPVLRDFCNKKMVYSIWENLYATLLNTQFKTDIKLKLILLNVSFFDLVKYTFRFLLAQINPHFY